jgi:hypothetical protein
MKLKPINKIASPGVGSSEFDLNTTMAHVIKDKSGHDKKNNIENFNSFAIKCPFLELTIICECLLTRKPSNLDIDP